jgi:hypothetical protein
MAQKIADYGIEQHNCYNVDEKGFMIGQIQKAYRVFVTDHGYSSPIPITMAR